MTSIAKTDTSGQINIHDQHTDKVIATYPGPIDAALMNVNTKLGSIARGSAPELEDHKAALVHKRILDSYIAAGMTHANVSRTNAY